MGSWPLRKEWLAHFTHPDCKLCLLLKKMTFKKFKIGGFLNLVLPCCCLASVVVYFGDCNIEDHHTSKYTKDCSKADPGVVE